MASDRTRLPGTWYRVQGTVPREAEDDLVGLLAADGCAGTTTKAAGPRRILVEAWFTDAAAAARGRDLVAGWPGAAAVADAPEAVEDPGWLEASLKVRGPLEAGRYVVLDAAPDVSRVAADRVAILLPPGRAFGTGEHATTRMCLALLDRFLRAGEPVLDLGTGSAILAIAAAKSGAGPVLALDNDPHVIDVARENLDLNGVPGGDPADEPRPGVVAVGVGSWGAIPKGRRFGLILANIHRTALVRGAQALARQLEPGGRAVLSGFHVEDAGLVRDAWTAAGTVPAGELHDGEWAALAMQRPDAG